MFKPEMRRALGNHSSFVQFLKLRSYPMSNSRNNYEIALLDALRNTADSLAERNSPKVNPEGEQ